MGGAKKILMIRFSSIGDIVLTTPVIRCLKHQLKGSEIHFLTKRQYEPVLLSNPFIDRIYLYDHNFRDLIPQLKSEGYTHIIDLHKNYRSSFVKRHFNNTYSTFSKLNIRKWLMVNLKINILPDLHIVDRYFGAVKALGVLNDGKGLDYLLPPDDEVPVSSLPATHQQGFVAIVIGARHRTKMFPVEKIAEVCRQFAQPVVLLGGKEDRERGEMIVSITGSMVLNTCGQFNLNQSASMVKQARSVLTNDTGLMHIAAAFNKPVVSVWGNTIPAFGMFPYLPKKSPAPSLIAENNHVSCRPCGKIGFSECPKKHFKCMNDLEIGPIVHFLQSNW